MVHFHSSTCAVSLSTILTKRLFEGKNSNTDLRFWENEVEMRNEGKSVYFAALKAVLISGSVAVQPVRKSVAAVGEFANSFKLSRS
jgi:hypothetical protein